MAPASASFSAKFLRCDAVTAAWEGGYVNHPDDPGKGTDRGVTQAVFDAWNDMRGLPRRSVKGITATQALQIFASEYWAKAGCEKLADGVDLAVYDASVNSGVSRGRKWLLASVGGRDEETVRKICARRLGFVQTLSIWKTFGKGWANRIADIEAKGVAWALAAGHDNHVVAQQLGDEAVKASKTASTQNKSAGVSGGAGVAGGTGLTVDPAAADHVASYVLGGMLVLGFAVAAYLVLRAVINAKRAKAYAQAASQTLIAGAV